MMDNYSRGLLFGIAGLSFVLMFSFLFAFFLSANDNSNKEEVAPVEVVVPFRDLQVGGNYLREFEPRPGVICYEGYQKLSCVKE
jgi:hypothetical protein